jgi:hypothetical protein
MIEIIWDEPFLRTLKKWRKNHPDLGERFQQKVNLSISRESVLKDFQSD